MSSTRAHCDNCGYRVQHLRLGGVSPGWPVSCNRCKAATTANIDNPPLTCIECQSTDVLPFNDATLWKGDGEVTDRWGELYLTNGHYRCPKCEKYELRFRAGLIE